MLVAYNKQGHLTIAFILPNTFKNCFRLPGVLVKY